MKRRDFTKSLAGGMLGAGVVTSVTAWSTSCRRWERSLRTARGMSTSWAWWRTAATLDGADARGTRGGAPLIETWNIR